jgi:hypothetical protein
MGHSSAGTSIVVLWQSVLSTVFGSKRQKVTERLRKLRSQEFRNLFPVL